MLQGRYKKRQRAQGIREAAGQGDGCACAWRGEVSASVSARLLFRVWLRLKAGVATIQILMVLSVMLHFRVHC